MNDRFKFRVWNKKHNEYIPSSMISTLLYFGHRDEFHIEFECFSTFADSLIIEQCTGLKDKNGNLIYEGDIVRGEKEIGTVKYGKHPRTNSHSIELGFYIDWEMKHPWRSDICYWTSPENPDCIEIIGNIHEQAEQKDK